METQYFSEVGLGEGRSFIVLETLIKIVMEKESIAAEIEPELKQQLRVAAAKEGISMSAYIRRAVKNQIKEDQSGNGTQTATTIS